MIHPPIFAGVIQNEQLAAELFKKVARRGHQGAVQRYEELREVKLKKTAAGLPRHLTPGHPAGAVQSELLSLFPGLLETVQNFEEKVFPNPPGLQSGAYTPSKLHRQFVPLPHLTRVASWPKAIGKE